MRRVIHFMVFVAVVLFPFAAGAQGDPRLRCGNYCWWNWQYACNHDYPNGMPGNPNYCWQMYQSCLAYHGQTPDDCDGGTGVGGDGEGPRQNCPIYINLGEPGSQREFGLTSAEGGLYFDVNADGTAERTAWAGPTSSAALLVRPNPDGSVSSGRNLFGNQSGWPNGYEMLRSAYDSNNDGVISADDREAGELRWWTDGQGGPDAVWDGVAQPNELRPFLSVVDRLWLNDRTTGYVDEHGNEAKWVCRAQLVKENGSNGKGRVVNTADWILRFVE